MSGNEFLRRRLAAISLSITAAAVLTVAGPGGRLMFYWNANGNPVWHPETVAGVGSV